MKNKIVSGYGKTFERLSKVAARKAFENGEWLFVMSIDRNPINSLSSPFMYHKGGKSMCGWWNGKTEIDTFDELLEDFSEWLDTDGYGHTPQRYMAKKYMFSYWKMVND